MSREEAWPLIEELADHAMQERFVYYHRWRGGDYRPEERRIMLRTIVYANGGRTRRAISG